MLSGAEGLSGGNKGKFFKANNIIFLLRWYSIKPSTTNYVQIRELYDKCNLMIKQFIIFFMKSFLQNCYYDFLSALSSIPLGLTYFPFKIKYK